ncbi:hypothetical protein FDP41_009175 [Naegleria fowleri]|uniref:Uncharacterized protein n=1 Tax=Naegleria fowleri TaxID=5763 RepID=A0A6A5BER6_NAEFO|nr:uncharacterized protein FDP41_009175 [Naegleria fowleri]KAF0972570.1 hypothetical protein FDP41_009175 [Naegleria fowleri]
MCSIASLILMTLTGVFFGIAFNSDAESYSVPVNCTVMSPLVQCEQSYGKRRNKYCSAIVCLKHNKDHNSTIASPSSSHSMSLPPTLLTHHSNSIKPREITCPQPNIRTTFRFEDSTIYFTFSEGFTTTCFENPKDRIWVSYEIYTPASSHWKIIGIISAIGSLICGVCVVVMFYRFYKDRKT